ncbi:SprT-like domain-containing protein [Halogranum rubrum]|uniref:SprT-like domain-containing protein n=1 Tax=Halogranum rubrum TaxID=553466 RepID=UPI0036F2A40E
MITSSDSGDERSTNEQNWGPSRLESETVAYASQLVDVYDQVLGILCLDEVEWNVSRRLFRAGGYCRSQGGNPPTHKIVISYPAYKCWGWSRVKEIIRHELAHAVVFEKYGPEVDPHGDEFRTLARVVDAPLRGEEPLPYRFELYCSVCERFIDGLYEPSTRTKVPRRYRSDCCEAPLELEENRPAYSL